MGKARELSSYDEGSYTPTVTAQSGSLTTVSATGKWLRIGDLIHLQVYVTITTNGTGAGYINVTLPFATANNGAPAVGCGREDISVGKQLQVRASPNSSDAVVFTYDNLYPGGNGYGLALSLTYIKA